MFFTVSLEFGWDEYTYLLGCCNDSKEPHAVLQKIFLTVGS